MAVLNPDQAEAELAPAAGIGATRSRRRLSLSQLAVHTSLLILLVLTFYPAIAMLIFSFKNPQQWKYDRWAPTVPLRVQNYGIAWDNVLHYLLNTVFVGVVGAEGKYPSTPFLTGNTPGEWGAVLEQAKEFLDRGPAGYPMLTLNAWNEWAEGSYLEPDTVHGLGYLEAIRRVFGARVATEAGRTEAPR